jgi:multicomponent Na+:H+ antiporter subunit F
MSGGAVLMLATEISLGLLVLAMFLTVIRLWRGPTLGDRILALDMITVLAVGLIAGFVVLTGFTLYIDIAIAIGLLGFLSTVALARYLLSRAADADEAGKARR